MYVVLIFHDGRNEYLTETLASFKKNVSFPEKPYHILLVDNPTETQEDYTALKKKFKIDKVVINPERLGIFGNVQKGWSLIPKETKYIFHLENDFTFNEPISVEEMQRPLDVNKHIYQVALLRQAWYQNEIKRGGIYQALGRFANINVAGVDLVSHRHYFTHNPCLYRTDIVQQLPNYNEYSFIQYLIKKDTAGMCCYLGKKTDSPKVHHIGEIKADGSQSAK